MTVSWDRLDLLFCRALGLVHFTLGVVTFIGGASRFPPPSAIIILQVTNGEVWPYAVLWTLAGAAMMAGHWRFVRLVGLVTSILITNAWASLFAVSAVLFDRATLTASVAYGGYGLLSALLLGMMIVHRRPTRRGG